MTQTTTQNHTVEDLSSAKENDLMEEISGVKKRLADARDSVVDTNFAKETEDVTELGRLKFKVRRRLQGHLAKISDINWAKDSSLLLTAAQDGKLIVWDTYGNNKLHAIILKTAWVLGCCFSPRQDVVASGGLDNQCVLHRLQELTSEKERELIGHDGFVSKCRFVDDHQLLTCSGDKTIILWDVERGTMISQMHGHDNDVNALEISDNSQAGHFVTGSSDSTCRRWDIRKKDCVQVFDGHTDIVNGVCYFPNNNLAFASASDDASCRLWDIRADQSVAIYTDEYIKGDCTCVSVSRSGRLLIAGNDDYNCHVWDVLREERVGILAEHEQRVSCTSISPDGVAIATGSWDSNCFIWTAK